MEMYQKAYQHYSAKCEIFEIDRIDFEAFMSRITPEQAEMMLEEIH